MKIVKLVSLDDINYRNAVIQNRRGALASMHISVESDAGTKPVPQPVVKPAPKPVTGQCHLFTGCNPAYALYANGDTYQQCVARRNNSSTPHSWRGDGLGCVDIP